MTATPTVATPVAGRWTISATTWFLAMVGGWIAFFTSTLVAPATVDELWSDVRSLSLLLEALVWLAAFPFVLATGVWETSWPDWLRVALVATFAVAWSVAFFPRPRRKEKFR